MKKFALFVSILFGMVVCIPSMAATNNRRTAPQNINAAASQPTAARSAVRSRSAGAVTSGVTPGVMDSRSQSRVGARMATSPVSNANTGAPTVVGRAASKQKVTGSGTTIATATKNIIVSDACQQKYDGCMDAFCMLDNGNGGRCVCSDRNAEYNDILAQIERLDQQSYQMATFGVEKLEMGADADDAIAAANAAANAAMSKVQDGSANASSGRRKLDMSMWNVSSDDDLSSSDDIFADNLASPIDGKEGDALYRAASELCVAQTPECSAEHSMLRMMYAQKIKSDCNAYENSLKQQKNSSAQKLSAAEQALRAAALEQLRTSNKYDLGQCTTEFKKCMASTAGCGDDFTGCVGIAAAENSTRTSSATKSKAKQYTIQGSATQISIAASSYDTLESKKPMCENVTKSCVRVADQVWPTFLREVAPQIKTAELIAESNLRSSCISNISQCFQKACKDTMDPNDPDGSYDLCLSRPESIKSLCKVQIDPCVAAEPLIMDFVEAKLAAMRVDACTNEVKSCLQSSDRCGKDYTQCVGLDTDTIIRMCPSDKLIACSQKYSADSDNANNSISGDAVYDELDKIVQGIFLNIDNNMLTYCQNAADEAMIKVCGDTQNCNGLAVDSGAGSRSFKYQVCHYDSISETDGIKWGGKCYDSLDGVSENELTNQPADQGWAAKISGLIYWGDIDFSNHGTDENPDWRFTTEEEYIDNLKKEGYTISADERKIISEQVFGAEIRSIESSVESAIQTIESDPTVQFCMTGRKVQGMKITKTAANGKTTKEVNYLEGAGRFPNLTSQMRQTIAISALKNARENYLKNYDKQMKQMMQDQITAAKRIDRNLAIQAAKPVCEEWAEHSKLPLSKAPKVKSHRWLKIVGAVAVVAAAVTATVLTMGAAAPIASALSAVAMVGIVGGTIAAGAVASVAAINSAARETVVGKANIDQWNYKENITTLFNETTGVCTRWRITQNCAKPVKNYCAKWEDAQESKEEINLID